MIALLTQRGVHWTRMVHIGGMFAPMQCDARHSGSGYSAARHADSVATSTTTTRRVTCPAETE